MDLGRSRLDTNQSDHAGAARARIIRARLLAPRWRTCALGRIRRLGVLGDTWLWKGNQWTHVSPATTSGEGTSIGMAYDAAMDMTVMVTGYVASAWTWGGQ